MQTRRLPGARNQSAAEITGDSPDCRRTFAGRRLVSDHGANQRVFHSWSEAPFAGRAITELFMTNTGHAELNGIFHDVLAEGGTQAFAESSYAAAPFVRAVAHMLDGRPSA